MNLGIDFSAQETKTMPDFLPAGTHLCKSVNAKWGRSANKGTPYMEIEWQCVKGEHKGGTTRERKYFTAGTAPYIKGWSKATMNVDMDGDAVNEKVYVNRIADVVVKKIPTGDYDTDGNEKKNTEVDSFPNKEYFSKNKPIKSSHGARNIDINSIEKDSYGNDNNTQPAEDFSNDMEDDDIPF